jgi:hypothetical protein
MPSTLHDSNIQFADSPSIDAFGRLRVSNPVTLFDTKQIFDDSDLASSVENTPLFYDNVQTAGSGTTTTYDVNKAQTTLTVAASTAGTRVRQSKVRLNYQPGKSLLVFMSHVIGAQVSGVTKREGYFDENNGIFLEDNGTNYGVVRRSKATESVVDDRIVQSSWNIDKMDGNGKSGINIDHTKAQILVIDFEWLGVGRVRIGFVVNGLLYYCHQWLNANNLSNVYMSTPNLPLRSEISNNGTGGTASLIQICSTVISEGGINPNGSIRSASTDGTQVVCSTENTNYAIIGVRLKSNYIGATIKILDLALQIQSASKMCEWSLIFNPTVAGSFTYVDESRSAIQAARGATANTVTGGYRIAGGYSESGNNASGGSNSISAAIENALTLGSTVAGVVDTIVLCAKPIGGTSNIDVEGSLTWREIY